MIQISIYLYVYVCVYVYRKKDRERDFIYFYFKREGKGGRRRGRETRMFEGNMYQLPLAHTQTQDWPTAQACAWTRIQSATFYFAGCSSNWVVLVKPLADALMIPFQPWQSELAISMVLSPSLWGFAHLKSALNAPTQIASSLVCSSMWTTVSVCSSSDTLLWSVVDPAKLHPCISASTKAYLCPSLLGLRSNLF